MKQKITTIIFDVGGVLALPKKQLQIYKGKEHNLGVYEYMAKKLKISLNHYFDAIENSYSKSVEGKFSKKQILKILSLYFNISPKKIEKLYTLAYEKHFNQNQQLFEQAFKLRQLGYKIGVLSDQWPIARENLMPNEFYEDFDQVVVSCDVKIRKPNPKIYKLILNKIHSKPSETLFIDNREWNLKPAKKLKIKTILYKDNKQLFKHPVWTSLFEEEE